MVKLIRASYRLQLRSEFDFDAAAGVTEYLSNLGISHVYASPYLQASPGSSHGYDVVDHSRVNEELGGEKGHAWFCRALGKNGLGQILDIVPNHMAISGPENRWWWDVLENGPSSRYAGYFDVDWEQSHQDVILLPLLGDHYGTVIDAGEIRLERKRGDFTLRYYDHVFPVAPRSLSGIFVSAEAQSNSPELGFIASALEYLPLPTVTDRPSTRRRHRDKEVIRQQLGRLMEEQPPVRQAVDAEVERINQDPEMMDSLLERQNYRLAYWRMARTDLGYRRFFDINDLAALRTEDEEVFKETHQLVLGWLKDGTLDGVRIDHPDGLRDPEEYLKRLRREAEEAYIVVEKILEPAEKLPASWPVQGTTGYDFMNLLGGVFIRGESEGPITQFYREFTGEERTYEEVLLQKKALVLRDLLGSDFNRLVELFSSICERNRYYRDYSREEIENTLFEVLVLFPVYRTYFRKDEGEREDSREEDRSTVRDTIKEAEKRRKDLDPRLFHFIEKLLLEKTNDHLVREFVMRFQQLTGPLMAKGAEDTAFYNFNRFIAINEVGGDPGRFGVAIEDFHKEMELRQRMHPLGMLSTSTHDTKRSEDVRARLCVLSEMPEAYINLINEIAALTEKYKTEGFPDRNFEYALYQTLIGAWPISLERILTYSEKYMREAKVYTSWTNQNEAYETACTDFLRKIYSDEEVLAKIEEFSGTLLERGRTNSLAWTLIKTTAPGIPDFYQGTELWSLDLVDPDNRRPVDFEHRKEALKSLTTMDPKEIVDRMDEGYPKLYIIKKALELRREHPEWFGEKGSYTPLFDEPSIVAYIRSGSAAVVVPRFRPAPEKPGSTPWEDLFVTLPGEEDETWVDRLTGRRVPSGKVELDGLFSLFSVALLVRERKKAKERRGQAE